MSSSFIALITGVKEVSELVTIITDNGLKYKEDENVIIIYSDENQRTGVEIADETKSLIIDKKTFQPIASQFNKILYNADTEKFLSDKDWSNVSIKECFEGTMIMVFHHNDKWYVCTRKCLDAKTSYWVKDVSYFDLFMEVIKDKFTFDDLNKNYSYHFILLHHLNKNIVNYTQFGEKYMNVALAMVTEKTTLKKVNCTINNKVIYPRTVTCNSLADVKKKLATLSARDVLGKQITIEGFILEYYVDGKMTILKLQTHLYEFVASSKPNVNNLDAMFLELYQRDKLVNIAPFFTQNSRDVVIRIHNSMRNLTTEFLKMYHITRNHKSPELYEKLPTSYKNVMYAIHGAFLKKKVSVDATETTTPVPVVEVATEEQETMPTKIIDHKSITVNDIYDTLKKVEAYTLRRVYIDRIQLLEDELVRQYLNCDCFDTLLQGRLMN